MSTEDSSGPPKAARDRKGPEEMRSAPERRAVVVLGMHRSGTSALAGFLKLLGCTAPSTLMGGDGSNARGHWESTVIRALNDDILESGGSEWQDWHQFPPRWYETSRPESFAPRAQAVLQDQFGDADLIVFKDPRVCRIFEFWRAGFARAGMTPLVIIPLRHPVEIAASLEKRNGLAPLHGLLLWLRHVLEAERTSRGLVRAVVRYETLLSDPIGLAHRLQEQLDVIWPRLSEKVREEIEEFIAPDLRHHRVATPDGMAETTAFRAWLTEVHGILLRWSDGEEDEADHARLDEIRQHMNEFATPMREVLATVRRQADDYSDLEADRDVLRSEMQSLQDKSARLERERQDLEARLDASRSQLDALRKDLDLKRRGWEQDRDSLLRQVKHLEAEAQAARTEAAEREAAWRRDREATLAELESARNRADAAAAEARADRSARDHERGLIYSELAAARPGAQKGPADISARSPAESDLPRDDAQAGLGEILSLARSLRVRERDLRARLEAERGRAETLAEARNRLALKLAAIVGRLVGDGGASRSPFARLTALRKARLLRELGLLDVDWYLEVNDDVRAAGMDPGLHFVRHGHAEGRAAAADLKTPRSSSPSSRS